MKSSLAFLLFFEDYVSMSGLVLIFKRFYILMTDINSFSDQISYDWFAYMIDMHVFGEIYINHKRY